MPVLHLALCKIGGICPQSLPVDCPGVMKKRLVHWKGVILVRYYTVSRIWIRRKEYLLWEVGPRREEWITHLYLPSVPKTMSYFPGIMETSHSLKKYIYYIYIYIFTYLAKYLKSETLCTVLLHTERRDKNVICLMWMEDEGKSYL